MTEKILIRKEEALVSEEALNRLSLDEQAGLFLVSGYTDRVRMLEMSHHPRELMAKIPATEVWFTIKQNGPDEALLLIKYSTSEQLQVIADIEWWRKDRISNTSIYEWLEYIAACGNEKIVEWFSGSDKDQMAHFFKTEIAVFKREEKDEDPADVIEWPLEEAPITYEGIYYFQALNEKHGGLIRKLLDVLAKTNSDLYAGIMDVCIWDIPSQREEEAYEVRSRRLAEHGFPSFDESLGVYSPLTESRFKAVKKRDVSGIVNFVPHYPLTVIGDKELFINRVLAELEVVLENRFLGELAGIANKVMVADGEQIDVDDLKKSLIKALGYTNIGLELLAGGDVARAAALIKEYWLVSIFQVGLNEVVKLSGEAKRIFKKSWMKGDMDSLALLKPRDMMVMENLLLKRPKYFSGEDELDFDSIRDFLSRDDISSAREIMVRAGSKRPD